MFSLKDVGEIILKGQAYGFIGALVILLLVILLKGCAG